MRTRFADVDYQPTRSVDRFERLAEEMVRTGNTGMDLGDDFDEEDERRMQEEYEGV